MVAGEGVPFACSRWQCGVCLCVVAPGVNAWGSEMFFVRKRLSEAVTVVATFSIPVGVFLLMNRHVPIWTAAITALLVLGASVWSWS